MRILSPVNAFWFLPLNTKKIDFIISGRRTTSHCCAPHIAEI